MVAKKISYNELEIFVIVNVKPPDGYCIIEPGPSFGFFHHFVEVETRGQKQKVTCNQLRKADVILQDDLLSLETKRIITEEVGYRNREQMMMKRQCILL